ncbi:hypothetical protein [Chitinophaga sp. sic0106]|uniref:hypothetical protein n=1 Tax=Chitinophaga sp. sic0106 TaxID=2854785 RepID=UPI001C461947|nr:hypothetical protein [Chitinophaga sp. sic0106]MBV7533472.1 hypothetical protein [Chitinophaga sp. sic0106]
MAREGLYLSIPSPCDQNWDEMVTAQDGRHCNNCRKTVIDFTQYSDEQIITFLKGHKGALCGHVHAGQLNRNLLPMVPQQRLVPVMLLTAGMLVVTNTADAQVNATRQNTKVVCESTKDFVRIKDQVCKAERADSIQPCVVSLQEINVVAYKTVRKTLTTGVIVAVGVEKIVRSTPATITIFSWDTHIPVPKLPSWLRKR